MATKWGAVIDAVGDKEKCVAAAKEGARPDYQYTDADGEIVKGPSTRPLRLAGFEALAAKAEENSASRGKSIAHSLNAIITRLSAPAGTDKGGSIVSRVVSLEKTVEKLVNERA